MAIMEETLFVVKCDTCEKTVKDMIGATAKFESKQEAKDAVKSIGWIIDKNSILCRDCNDE